MHPAVVFFCHTFCISECRAELVQAMPSVAKYHEVIFAKGKKDVCTEIYPGLKRDRHHRAALAPEKKQLKAIIHNMKL